MKHRTRRRACALEKKNWTSAYRNSGPAHRNRCCRASRLHASRALIAPSSRSGARPLVVRRAWCGLHRASCVWSSRVSSVRMSTLRASAVSPVARARLAACRTVGIGSGSLRLARPVQASKSRANPTPPLLFESHNPPSAWHRRQEVGRHAHHTHAVLFQPLFASAVSFPPAHCCARVWIRLQAAEQKTESLAHCWSNFKMFRTDCRRFRLIRTWRRIVNSANRPLARALALSGA